MTGGREDPEERELRRLESGVEGESELVSLGREDELVDEDEGLDMVGGVVESGSIAIEY